LRILLPITKVIARLDLHRITQNGRSTMRSRSQANNLRRKCYWPIVVVNRLVMKRNAYCHDFPFSKTNPSHTRSNLPARQTQTLLEPYPSTLYHLPIAMKRRTQPATNVSRFIDIRYQSTKG
jgi:hypothetical protein